MSHLMVRDLDRLTAHIFDAVVVGGGVYGLATTRELAGRGFSVALLERADFSAATSFNSLKTVHGGIRALQHGAMATMREFVRERRGIARIAPHLVRPLRFVVPTTTRPPRTPAVMRLFLAAYDALSADRNDGVDPSLHLPRSRVVSRDECLELNPLISPDGVSGGAVWYDYQLHSPERFAMALLQTASARGATSANYAEVQGIVRNGSRVLGVRARDLIGGNDIEVRARTVINATGPGSPALLRRLGVPVEEPIDPAWSLALNVVLDLSAPPSALGGLADGRFLFLVPWRSQSIVGTSHERLATAADAIRLEDHLNRFLTAASTAFPRANLSPANIRLVHRGMLPAPRGGRDSAALLKDSIVYDHQRDGFDGLLTVIGVRYTTARATAARVARHVSRKLARPTTFPLPLLEPVHGGDIADLDRLEREATAASRLDAATVRRLVAAHGTGYGEVVRLMTGSPTLASPLGARCAVTGAEIVHAVREEMAVHLTDALLRRTAAGSGGHPGSDAVSAAAAVMAGERRWSPEETARQTEAVERFYTVPRSLD
jgi:glycerol-3-phosphate dehydrogenase